MTKNRLAALGPQCRAIGELAGGEPTQLAGGHGGAEYANRGCGMEAALAQVGMTGPADGNLRLISGDERLDQRRTAHPAFVAEGQQHRHHHATRVHRALAETIVELDPVGGGAAQERRIEKVGAARASRHRHAAGRTNSEIASGRLATSPPAPAIITPTVSSNDGAQWRNSSLSAPRRTDKGDDRSAGAGLLQG
jgi:hypothetical protein